MIAFFVPGTPKTAGSKRAFMRPGMKFPVIVDDCAKGKDWRGDVKRFAVEAYRGEPLTGPLDVKMLFCMARPKAHFRTGKLAGQLRPDAEVWHERKPDVLKMARAVEDALTGILWVDDAQICVETLEKVYGAKPGVHVEVKPAELRAYGPARVEEMEFALR